MPGEFVPVFDNPELPVLMAKTRRSEQVCGMSGLPPTPNLGRVAPAPHRPVLPPVSWVADGHKGIPEGPGAAHDHLSSPKGVTARISKGDILPVRIAFPPWGVAGGMSFIFAPCGEPR